MSQAEDTKIRNDEVEWEPRPTLASADYASLRGLGAGEGTDLVGRLDLRGSHRGGRGPR